MSRTVTLLGYVVLVALGLGLETRARRRGGATFGDVMGRALRWWPIRLLLLAGWMWLGWHLFVRVDWQ